MSNKINIIVIANKHDKPRQLRLSSWVAKTCLYSVLLLSFLVGFVGYDYSNLYHLRSSYNQLVTENKHLRSEAHVLEKNLDVLKDSLHDVQTYSQKIDSLLSVKLSDIKAKTGVKGDRVLPMEQHVRSRSSSQHMPIGIDINKLSLGETFAKLRSTNDTADKQAYRLKSILTSLGQKQSLLAAIPSMLPVKGWITSGFGYRISPFTNKKTFHRGMDIAAPVGTPIHAPADGVVIFSGKKSGFGNFIMIAHYSHSIITRYGHNAQNIVSLGQNVRRGEQIATVGRTGRTTGPHLHYEVLVDGHAVNPRRFVLDTMPLL